MTTRLSLFEFMPYGAPELIGAARKNMFRATVAGSALALAAFVLAGLASRVVLEPAPRPVTVEIGQRILMAPPPLEMPRPQTAAVAAPSGHVRAGVAVPVPDRQARPDETIADQTRLGVSTPAAVDGAPPIPAAPPPEDKLPGMNEPVYVEELPAPITTAEPPYPEIARQAGVDGLVLVHVLVGKDGRVIDAQVDPKRNVPMLNDVSLEAARKWTFKPGLANGHAVTVWVVIPFNFHLR